MRSPFRNTDEDFTPEHLGEIKKEKWNMYGMEDRTILMGFTYACGNYHMKVPDRGNVWKSMIEHDSEKNDILCDRIPFNSFRFLESGETYPHST